MKIPLRRRSRTPLPRPTILEALRDPTLFGAHPAFHDLTPWATWLIVLAAIYGLPLTEEQARVFCTHTGRSRYAPAPGGYPEVVVLCGRRSGKTQMSSVITAYESAWPMYAPSGESYALMVAQDQRAALRTLFSYSQALFRDVSALASLMRSETTDALRLTSGITLSAYPCRPAALRGLTATVAVLDELAFYRSAEGNPVDVEMLRAVRPTLATTGGKLIILSSPYAQQGALWDLHRQHYGQDDATTLVWQASAPAMNPTLPADYLARMERDDPDAFASEVLGQFRVGITALFDGEALEACVARGIRERGADGSRRYVAFFDVSGGRRDAAAIAISHHENGRAVLDVARWWPAPSNPSGVIAETADLLRVYRIREVVGDRYAGEFVTEGFRSHGITYRASELDRSGLYLGLLPLVNSARAELLDVPELLRQLRGLERRRGPSGRDRVDHAPGAHDDIANACAGALGLAAKDGDRLQIYVSAPAQDSAWMIEEQIWQRTARPLEDVLRDPESGRGWRGLA